MLLIILYHIPSSHLPRAASDSLSSGILHYLHQPGASLALFFILAGLFTKKVMSWKKWSHRLLSLLIPYIIWNLLCTPGLNDEITFSRVFGIGSSHNVCADYPLWFILSLIYMTLLLPVWKHSPELALAICLAFILSGNTWHCDFLRYAAFPVPSYFAFFLLGVVLARLSLSTIYKILLYFFPLFLALYIIFIYYGSAPGLLILLNTALLILASIAWFSKLFPALTSRIAPFSSVVFLVYVTHAGIILLLGYAYLYCGSPCKSLLAHSHLTLAILIYLANLFAFHLMRRYTPALLPFLAHHGSFPRTSAPKKSA